MKYNFVILILFFSLSVNAKQEILGVWKSKDHKSGKDQALIEVYVDHNQVHARIIKALDKKLQDFTCTNCTEKNRDKPMEGMVILKDLKKSKVRLKFTEGYALNPFNGKFYKCNAELIDENLLRFRGYIGVSLFGKSEYWYRVKKN